MTEQPAQLASTEGMSPEEIAKALEDGLLTEYLRKPRKRRDLGKRMLANMTPEQINRALETGELDAILRGDE